MKTSLDLIELSIRALFEGYVLTTVLVWSVIMTWMLVPTRPSISRVVEYIEFATEPEECEESESSEEDLDWGTPWCDEGWAESLEASSEEEESSSVSDTPRDSVMAPRPYTKVTARPRPGVRVSHPDIIETLLELGQESSDDTEPTSTEPSEKRILDAQVKLFASLPNFDRDEESSVEN